MIPYSMILDMSVMYSISASIFFFSNSLFYCLQQVLTFAASAAKDFDIHSVFLHLDKDILEGIEAISNDDDANRADGNESAE